MHNADPVTASFVADKGLLQVLVYSAKRQDLARTNHDGLVVVAHDSVTAKRLALGRPLHITLLFEG